MTGFEPWTYATTLPTEPQPLPSSWKLAMMPFCTIGPRFESSHQQTLIYNICLLSLPTPWTRGPSLKCLVEREAVVEEWGKKHFSFFFSHRKEAEVVVGGGVEKAEPQIQEKNEK